MVNSQNMSTVILKTKPPNFSNLSVEWINIENLKTNFCNLETFKHPDFNKI